MSRRQSRAAWNVGLWIANDEGLYRMAKSHIRQAKNRVIAAQNILDELRQAGIDKTPDGYPYSYTTIRAATRPGPHTPLLRCRLQRRSNRRERKDSEKHHNSEGF